MRAIAPAKINLALHVGAGGADGYHPVDTVCAFVDIGEYVEIGEPAAQVTLAVDGPMATGVPTDERNLVVRGAKAVGDRLDISPHHFRLYKTAPAASGMGVGTADGAAAMWLMNQQSPSPLSADALVELSNVLGADGPVCMSRLVAPARLLRARGRGERVTVGPSVAPFWLCLTNPGVSVSTADVFTSFDKDRPPMPFDLTPPPEEAVPLPPAKLGAWMMSERNDLTAAAQSLASSIRPLVDQMRAMPGAEAARMTGSGATIFGLFASQSAADHAARVFAEQGLWSAAGPALSGPQGRPA